MVGEPEAGLRHGRLGSLGSCCKGLDWVNDWVCWTSDGSFAHEMLAPARLPWILRCESTRVRYHFEVTGRDSDAASIHRARSPGCLSVNRSISQAKGEPSQSIPGFEEKLMTVCARRTRPSECGVWFLMLMMSMPRSTSTKKGLGNRHHGQQWVLKYRPPIR